MTKIRVRKCKNNDTTRFRFRRDGTSKDLTQKELSRFKTLNLISAPSINFADQAILINEYPNHNVKFISKEK